MNITGDQYIDDMIHEYVFRLKYKDVMNEMVEYRVSLTKKFIDGFDCVCCRGNYDVYLHRIMSFFDLKRSINTDEQIVKLRERIILMRQRQGLSLKEQFLSFLRNDKKCFFDISKKCQKQNRYNNRRSDYGSFMNL